MMKVLAIKAFLHDVFCLYLDCICALASNRIITFYAHNCLHAMCFGHCYQMPVVRDVARHCAIVYRYLSKPAAYFQC